MKKITGIVSGFIGILFVVLGFTMKRNEPAAVSIIGGADGPTSIFLAGKLGGEVFNFLMAMGVILVLITVIVFLKKKR